MFIVLPVQLAYFFGCQSFCKVYNSGTAQICRMRQYYHIYDAVTPLKKKKKKKYEQKQTMVVILPQLY